MHTIDETDLKILDLLQENARIRRNDLAEKVGLTIPAVSDRLRKLEEKGLITGYRTHLDFKIAGYDILAFIYIYTESSKYYSNIIHKVMDEPEILECHAITGEGSHLLKVLTQNTSTLEKLLSRIQAWPGITGTKTNIVLSSIKTKQNIKVIINSERK